MGRDDVRGWMRGRVARRVGFRDAAPRRRLRGARRRAAAHLGYPPRRRGPASWGGGRGKDESRAGRGRVMMSEIAGDIIDFDVSEGDTRLEGGSNRGNRARVWTHHRG
jgi:hypothetical protein